MAVLGKYFRFQTPALVLIALIAIALSALAVPPVLRRPIPSDVDGNFIQLSHGRVRYKLEGPVDGPLIVFSHGFSGSMENFDRSTNVLVDAGYRLLRFDIYGRGYSDMPTGAKQTGPFMVQQIAEMLFALRLNKPFTLVGLSMGGAIATLFAETYPEHVARLVLLATAGMPTLKPFVANLVQIPILGEYLMKLFGERSSLQTFEVEWFNPSVKAEVRAMLNERIRHQFASSPGLPLALLSTLRYFPLDNIESSIAAVGAHSRPLLMVWGRNDTLTPYANAALMQAHMPRAKLVTIEEAKHLMLAEKSEEVNEALLSFLKETEV